MYGNLFIGKKKEMFPMLGSNLVSFYICYAGRHVIKMFVMFYWTLLQ